MKNADIYKIVQELFGEGRDATAGELKQAIFAIAPKGKKGHAFEAARMMASKIVARRDHPKAWTVSEQRAHEYSQLMRNHSTMPWTRGGTTETVSLGDELGCDTSTTFSGAYGGWPVRHYTVTWTIPRTWRLRLIEGVVTAVPPAYSHTAQRREPIPCAWPKKTRGMSGAWVIGWLYRGHHGKGSAESVRRRVDQQRAREARKRLDNRRQMRPLRSHWVTVESAKAAGACDPGIESFLRRFRAKYHPTGTVGAVRADIVETLAPGWGSRAAKV